MSSLCSGLTHLSRHIYITRNPDVNWHADVTNESSLIDNSIEVSVLINHELGHMVVFSQLLTRMRPSPRPEQLRKTDIERHVETLRRFTKSYYSNYDGSTEIVIIEFNYGARYGQEVLDLGQGVYHYTERQLASEVYRDAFLRRDLIACSTVLATHLDRSLASHYIARLKDLPDGNAPTDENSPSLASQYQHTVAAIFDFVFDYVGIEPCDIEHPTRGNNRLDILFFLSRCTDVHFNQQLQSKYRTDKLLIECKNSKKNKEIINGSRQLASYVTMINGGALSVLCARDLSDCNKQTLLSLQKSHSQNDRPLLILADADLQQLLQARISAKYEYGLGGVAWLQKRFDKLDV